MIRRIVKMSFVPEEVDAFIAIFSKVSNKIENFPGCKKVELLINKDQPNMLFTISLWESTEALNNYRQSEFFRDTWSKTKLLFADKPEAWSLELTGQPK
ncbi:MAG: antibiotic biosynthesis monooxygenase family protein [Chitinophagales bacterium]